MTGNLDPTRYEALIEHLLDLQRRESSLDPLSASFEALSAVIEFLNADTRLLESEANRSLGRLSLALHDRMQGAKPKLFFNAPDRMGAKGAPSYTSAVILRTLVNAAFLSLREADISQQEASRWLATKLKHAGIKQPTGEAIDARAIVRWGAELGHKSLRGSDQIFTDFVLGAQRRMQEQYPQEHSDAPLTPQQAKSAAAGFMKLLKIAGF
jgi:hypothetical protein